MPISLHARFDRKHAASPMKGVLLYVLCGSLALYPLLEKFVAPVIGIAYLVAGAILVGKLLSNGLRIPRTYLGWVWSLYTIVYVTWYAIAMLHGNVGAYISQDSLGFLLYFGAMPILFLFMRFERLETTFFRFIVDCSTFIAVISIAVVGGYFVVFGEIQGESLLLLNAFLANLGLSWQIDNNAGLLGVYTYTGHIQLLGIAIVLYRYSLTQRKKDLALVALYLVGIVLDGHRALVVSALLQLLILAPRLLATLSMSKKVALLSVLAIVPTVAAVMNLDWIAARFDFTTNDPSTAERYAQIPALIDKIAENPILGSGFGSVAAYIRSQDRPFSYEMDFLATAMKLGFVGSLIYFGTYLAALGYALTACGRRGLYLVSAGLPFFFYMGTNGGQAMSTDSAIFHIFLFLLIDFAARDVLVRRARLRTVQVGG